MWRGGRVLILVAHPDDETLACGGEMEHWPGCLIVHTTTGSPRDVKYARDAGFASQAEYAEARQRELACSLSHVGGRETANLGLTDQESWRDLAFLTRRVKTLIEEINPAAIVTHPYEGGHPDHDAAAFAVQHSCTQLGSAAPVRIEGAFYNRFGGQFQTNRFLPGVPETEIELASKTQTRKEKMFACFASQSSVLALFSTSVERFRFAPEYVFSQPAHEGPLNYETLGWGITSAMWIESVRQAEAELAG
jgi:LmbE family N-acetylglucosaminyl deacetylase